MSGIILVALSAFAMQDAGPRPYNSQTNQLYRPPAVRPFEPPSDFGREVAEGDAETGVHRRPLTAPVIVEAYSGSYETSPTDLEIAYDQGVASAEIRADSLAGPLDGRWRVTDGQGRFLLDLVLRDDPETGLFDGAWRDAQGDIAPFVSARRDGGEATVALDEERTLRLEREGGVWRGRLSGVRGAVTLTPAG